MLQNSNNFQLVVFSALIFVCVKLIYLRTYLLYFTLFFINTTNLIKLIKNSEPKIIKQFNYILVID